MLFGGITGITVSRYHWYHEWVPKFGKIFPFIYDITYLLFINI